MKKKEILGYFLMAPLVGVIIGVMLLRVATFVIALICQYWVYLTTDMGFIGGMTRFATFMVVLFSLVILGGFLVGFFLVGFFPIEKTSEN